MIEFLHYIVLAILVVIAIIDIKTKTIPNKLNGQLLIIGAVISAIDNSLPWESRFTGMLIVALPMFLINLLYDKFKGQIAFGGGDIKLLFTCGYIFGKEFILTSTLFAMIMAGVWGIILVIFKKEKANSYFALGPFLVMAMVATYFYVDVITSY